MASDPIAQNVEGVRQLVGSKINKSSNQPITSQEEGVQGEKIDSLELTKSDEDLILLAKKWEARYAPYEAKIQPRQERNLKWYLGKQKDGGSGVPDEENIAANILFEAEETFLPAALSRNPEPVVWSDNSNEGNQIADAVKTMLQYHADILVLRSKLTLMVRKWSVDMLGVLKHGWDSRVEDIKTEVRDAKNFIFDPNGYVDSYGDFVGYLGERITVSAEKLIEMFPKHTAYITVNVDGKMGTQVKYTEWWEDDYCFYTYKDKVLDKHKNPHFNYAREEVDPLSGENEVIKGKNHFAYPKKPYTFLSVYTLQRQPHDETGLIEQSIPNQNLVSRRVEQIDFNISRTNNATAYSANNFTQETAKQAATAKKKGHPVLIPSGGPIKDAMVDFPPNALPASFFEDLNSNINNLRTIFGVQGITAQKQDEDQTARGMILQQQYDNSRIGGGIGDRIEQVADNVFNWWTQLYYIYYDEPHYASVIGQLRATQYIELSAHNLNAKLVVSVAPDSMKPHDEVTEMNQAMSLWEAGAIDPQTLLQRLNFPNPKETAGQLWLWKTNPALYGQLNFPDLAQMIQQQQAQMMAMGQPVQGQPPQGAPAPEALSEPAPPVGGVPANSALNQVALPK